MTWRWMINNFWDVTVKGILNWKCHKVERKTQKTNNNKNVVLERPLRWLKATPWQHVFTVNKSCISNPEFKKVLHLSNCTFWTDLPSHEWGNNGVSLQMSSGIHSSDHSWLLPINGTTSSSFHFSTKTIGQPTSQFGQTGNSPGFKKKSADSDF